MKPLLKVGIVLFICLTFTGEIQAKKDKIEKAIEEIEYLHKIGDNFKAIDKLDKLESKIAKKSIRLNEHRCVWNLLKAKCHAATGQFTKARDYLDAANKIYESELPVGSTAEIRVLRLLGEYYMDYRLYLEVEEKFKNSLALAYLQVPMDSVKVYDQLYELLQARVAKGDLYRFKSLYDSLHAFYKPRAVKEIYKYNAKKGKLKRIKLKKDEVLARASDYARLRNFEAYYHIQKGNYAIADSLILLNEDYIKDEIGKASNAYNRHLVNEALLEEGRGDYKEAFRRWEDVVDNARLSGDKNFVKDSPEILEAYESLISVLIKDGRFGYARDYIREFTSTLNTVLRYRNIYQNKIDHLKIVLAVYDQNWPLARRDLQNILRDSVTVPKNHPERLKYLETFYKMSMKIEEVEEAEKYLKEIMYTAERSYGRDSPKYHRFKIISADFDLNHAKGDEELNKELEYSYDYGVRGIWSPNHMDYADFQDYYLGYLEFYDRNKDALKELDKTISYFESKDLRNLNYTIQLDQQARFYYNLGFYSQMETNLDSAEMLYDQLKKEKTFEYAEHLLNRSRLYFVEGRFKEAEDFFRDAIKRSQKSEKDNPFMSFDRIENELASLYIAIGDYSRAERITEQEISYITEALNVASPRLIDPYNNKARLFLLQGDFSSAEAYNKKALDISKMIYGESSLRHSKSLEVQKFINLDKGDFKKAGEITNDILERQRQLLGENHILVSRSIADLAEIRYNMGEDAQTVLSRMDYASNIAVKQLGPSNPFYANILRQKAFIEIREGRIDKAEPLLDSAFNIWIEKVGDNSLEAADLEVLRGELFLIQKDFDRAENNFKEALRVYNRIFNKEHPKYVKTISLLARVFYIKKDYPTCIEYLSKSMKNYLDYIDRFFPSMSEREKNKYWSLVRGDFEFFNTVATKMYEEEPDLIGDAYGYSLTTKAILLNSTLKVRQSIANSGNAVLIKKYNDWISKKELLSTAVSMNEVDLEKEGIDIDFLKDEIELLEKDLSRMSNIFSRSITGAGFDWKDVRKKLEENEAAVEIIRFRKYNESFTDTIIYAALIITKDTRKSPDLVLLENGSDMEGKFFKGYKNRIRFKLSDPVSYKTYWAPIEAHLQEIEKIYLSVDGVYNQINIETLLKPDGKYVIDDKNIILLSNTKEIIQKKGRLALMGKKEAVLFGNPTYHARKGSLDPLPGAEMEVQEVNEFLESKGWKCEVKLNQQATEMAAKNLRSPKVFHIATHGFFVPSQKTQQEMELEELGLKQSFDNTLLKSGLVMDFGGDLLDNEDPINFNKDNGLLTAYEAMNLNLDETDLVVLSACETGLGDVSAGEGVYGLQRSLIVAGSRSVIMSLFKVSDEATQKLMLKFYEKWLGGMDKRTAFIEAKREMKTEYPEPLYWGAFVMIGFD